jgi:uncharacterized protein (DUF1697 family)
VDAVAVLPSRRVVGQDGVTAYVALLHSVTLSAGQRVVMNDLREMAAGLGLKNVRTLVATGNLVFDGADLPPGETENMLEAAFATTFDKAVDIVVRDAGAWLKLVAGNPFTDGAGSEVVVRVMRRPLAPEVFDGLGSRATGPERIALVDGDLWIDFSGKPSQSRLLSALSRRQLGVGTLRNWNTVRGIGRMLAG